MPEPCPQCATHLQWLEKLMRQMFADRDVKVKETADLLIAKLRDSGDFEQRISERIVSLETSFAATKGTEKGVGLSANFIAWVITTIVAVGGAAGGLVLIFQHTKS